jgi:hypothetical protein
MKLTLNPFARNAVAEDLIVRVDRARRAVYHGAATDERCAYRSQLSARIVSRLPSMSTRDDMNASLRAQLVPALRSRGFRGSLPHFQRILANRIDLLTVQFDKWGGGFVVEISRCGPQGVTTHGGKEIPPRKVTAHDVHPNQRHRLGSPAPGEDGRWFRYDDGTPIETVAAAASGMLTKADQWWDAS